MNLIKKSNVEQNAPWSKGLAEVEVYKEAYKNDMTVSMYLEKAKSESQGEQSPYYGLDKPEVMAVKNAYRQAGKVAPLTAFEQILEAADIKVTGSHSSPMGKFFEYSDTSVWFPEYTMDRVYAGQLQASIVPQLIFATTITQAPKVDKMYMQDTEDDRQLRIVEKMEDLPKTTIKLADQSIPMVIYGRYRDVSKIDLNQIKADAFGRMAQRVGLQLGIEESDLAVNTIINGDGNANTTPGTTVPNAGGAGTIVLGDAVDISRSLPAPYKANLLIGNKANLNTWIVTLYGFGTASVGNDIFNTFPEIVEWDRAVITANNMYAIDNRYSLEKFSIGQPVVEAENLVRKIGQGFAIHTMVAFGVADRQANALFDLT